MSKTFWQHRKLNPYPTRGAFSALHQSMRSYGVAATEPSKGAAALVIPLAMIAVLYFGFFADKKKKSNPRRRRRNGTKRGQYRKTARRAYAKKRRNTRRRR